MEWNERVAAARKAAGLTQEALGEKLGVSRQAVSKWESGASDPSTSNLLALARLYGVSAALVDTEQGAVLVPMEGTDHV